MNKAMAFWNKVATKKDNKRYITDLTESEAVQRTLQYLKPHYTVLDFGCRTGNNTLAIAEHVHQIFGLDHSPIGIEHANRWAQTKEIENVQFNATDLFDPIYKEHSFDSITAYHVLHLLDKPDTIMHRLNALLKPGGLLISATICWGEGRSMRKAAHELLSKLKIIPRAHKFSVAEMENMVTSANFEIMETQVLDEGHTDYFLVAEKQ